jgi:hypothetical protein
VSGPTDLGRLFLEEEERRLAEGRAEIAAERAAGVALPDEERAARTAAAEDKWAAFADACDAAEEWNGDEDADQEEDEE